MLNFDKLSELFKHLEFTYDTLGVTDIFFVGGAIRDILLGIQHDPKDIDCTLAGHPNEIREHMKFDEATASRFRTEKFGTMTLLPKSSDYEYELTPLRTEGGYTDVRHPDDIQRSNDVLADSARRDFTINCLYRYGATVNKLTIEIHLSDNSLAQSLKSGNNVFVVDSNTLIIQDHKSISLLFKDGVFQKESLDEVLCAAEHISKSKESDLLPSGTIIKQLSILIDPHGGLLDLLGGKIRTVGDSHDRFTEDALRIIRGVRFVNILNQHKLSQQFDFEKKTRLAMQQHAHLVSQLSGERIHDELKKVFCANNPFGYISLLHELKLLPILFPAVADTIHNDQPTRHHSLDTFHHTLMTLKEGQQLFLDNEYLPLVALLYHDVGKPEQYTKMGEAIAANPDDPDRSTYEYHTESGAKLAQQDLQKLCFSKKEIEEVMRYIRRHHRPGEILDGKQEKRPVRMRKLMSDGGYLWTKHLLKIVIADRRGQHNPLQLPQIDDIHHLDVLLDQLYADEGRFTLQELAVSGQDLMDEFKLSPGPQVGVMLHKAFDRVIGEVSERNQKDKICIYLRSL